MLTSDLWSCRTTTRGTLAYAPHPHDKKSIVDCSVTTKETADSAPIIFHGSVDDMHTADREAVHVISL